MPVPLGSGTVGPDGAAYVLAGPHDIERVDGDGAATKLELSPGPEVDGALTASEGALPAATRDHGRLARITPGGATTSVPSGRPACRDDDPPRIDVTPGRANRLGYGTVSLAALRRAHGFKIRLRRSRSRLA